MLGCALRAISAALLITLLACSEPQAKAAPRPPAVVVVETATTAQVPVEVSVIGNVVSISSISVRSHVDGQIERVFFREGQAVRKGAPLFQIDARPYKVALERAGADTARDQAQLRQADIEEKRYGALVQQKLVSAQEYDQRVTALETLRATLQADRSALDNAKLNLEYTKIDAPISGRTGTLQITAGNLVKANTDPPLVVIRQLSPICVSFAVPSDRLSEIRKYAGKGTLVVQAAPHGEAGDVPARGELTFIDNSIDVASGTIALKATFPNEDDTLWPGQFVDVKMELSALPNATVVPSRAVSSSQRGDQVFVVTDALTAEARQVKTGIHAGEQTVIEEGVAPGERVVVDGQLNLVNGANVVIKGSGATRFCATRRGSTAVNVSGLFIRRPVATLLLMLALLVFGTLGYMQLPVSDLPSVDFPTITVTANLPGASPETMAAAVATPLEKQMSAIAGLDSMSSTSALGVTQITLQFNLSRSLDNAAQDVQAAIGTATRQLPQNMPTPPSYQKVNPADQPILYLALTSADLPLPQLDEYAQVLMAQRISMVSGVALVSVFGSQKFAVRVQMNPDAMATRNIDLDQVVSAVQNANVNLPAGVIWGHFRATTVQATGQLNHAEDYRPVIVTYQNGKPVRLSDLGQVIDGVEQDKNAAWFRDQRSLVLAIQRQPGTNTVEVARAVRALMPKFRAQMPASVSMHVVYDRSELIEESVNDVKGTLVLALVLVILVIFLFLRNASATFIAGLALPLSMVGTFAAMYMFGYSLDNLSLMALTLSVGFVVDDAIVMLENIVRHMELGSKPLDAALEGSKEIGFTIISMTISLAAVFIPVLFMGGILGRLFHEFAVTIGVAILISGFISLTLTPMLGSRMLRAGHQDKQPGLFYRATEAVFDWMLKVYDVGLVWALRHRVIVLLLSLVTLGATVLLFQSIPKGLFPNQDTGQIFGATETAQGTSFENMVKHQRQVADVLLNDPNIEVFMSSCGPRGTGGANTGTVFGRLKPRSQRKLSADQVIEELRPKLAQIPGIRTYMQNPPTIRLGGMLTKSQYQYTLQSTDQAELYRAGAALEEKMRAVPELQDVTSDLQMSNPQLTVTIDRDKASSLGVTAMQIESALYNAYAGRQISTIYAANNTYQVILELMPDRARDEHSLSSLYVRSNSGNVVPLNAIAALTPSVGPLTIAHLGQLPAVTVSFNLKLGASLGPAIAAVERAAHNVLPANVTASFQGTAQAFASSQAGLGALLVLAILVIYMVLGILYESFIHPITILSALPFAGFGALATLWLFHEELSIYAFVGVIMLVGLVKKNGIMMIDFALEVQRKEHKSAHDAIYEACRVRFRPITMTTVAALMGTLPIALGIGAGAEARRPLGLAVVGGLLFSQILTLYVTPVFFLVMDKLVNRNRRAGPRLADPEDRAEAA